ncbi:predicted ATPases involved in pili biogenesis, PilT [Psychromonas ingrahamii 37]|uniref:Predicted ATPases involved in pili biogenesis, PilT n=1 Tax=Psychromonas ingrahamii (strain DSM 17664 / CCUG 51855 / 37) TaxID=357804 RepID=A1T0L7_PSYIN|nr:flagellar export chaperone FlgN [Psychromonas ingrahamii]ABM05282.1 predicted ATPases involved in pili biogenesis, PilT [Psychromonas ingrahamii 37]
MTKKEMLTIFHRTIVSDFQVACALTDLLESVRDSCLKMDGESLSCTNDKIIASIDALRKNHLKRLKIVNAFGFSQKIDKFVASLPPKINTQLSAELEKLFNILRKCEQKNNNNGQLFAGQHELISQLSKQSINIKI